MVTFKLVEKSEKQLVYHYFPEGKENDKFGIISLDISNGSFNIVKIAKDDFKITHTKEELNELKNSINEMRKKRGEAELTEELPTATEDVSCLCYANCVITELRKSQKNEETKETGSVVWY